MEKQNEENYELESKYEPIKQRCYVCESDFENLDIHFLTSHEPIENCNSKTETEEIFNVIYSKEEPFEDSLELENYDIKTEQDMNSAKCCDLRIDPSGKSLNIKDISILLFRLNVPHHRKYKEKAEIVHSQDKKYCDLKIDPLGKSMNIKDLSILLFRLPRKSIISTEKTGNMPSKNYKCIICGKTFSLTGGLKRHIKTAHEGRRRYHRCDHCGKSFSEFSNLKKHIKFVHEGQKDHKCEHCGKSFSEFSYLKKHIKTIHEGQGNINVKTAKNPLL